MDEIHDARTVPGWFMIAAIAALLFMALGCLMFLLHVTADPNAMPIEQRTVMLAEPTWVKIANGIAVIAGVIGAVLLVLKNRLAEVLLLAALVATIAWLLGLVVVQDLRENMSANDLIIAIVVTALTWTIFWFARHSRQRGWLK
jgi:hypothetical protein